MLWCGARNGGRSVVGGRSRSVPRSSALRDFLVRGLAGSGDTVAFFRLIEETPELREYSHRMWMRYEAALARVIAEQSCEPLDDTRCIALAHFMLETRNLARAQPDPRQAIQSAFDLLENGWSAARPCDAWPLGP
jgi:hypothetical protein